MVSPAGDARHQSARAGAVGSPAVHLDLWVALAGLLVGFTVGLTGMGGGALMTPLLVLAFGIQPLASVSSDLVADEVMKPIGGAVHLRRPPIDPIAPPDPVSDAETLTVKPWPTLAIGVIGGLVVGMTSVGSGSIMIVLLLFLYPKLKASQLVGTDLVQAIPLVPAAAIGHLLFGDFQLDLTTSLLLGPVPGGYIGARVSVRAPDHVIRPALLFVLVASALKLLGLGNVPLAVIMGVLLVAGGATFMGIRARRNRIGVVGGTPAVEPGGP